MEPRLTDFHLEEYRQVRSEVVGLLEKVEQYFRYAVLVPTAIYSWLLTSAIGTGAAAASVEPAPCLKLPVTLLWVAWLIPPFFVVFCGLIALAFSVRVSQMGTYLLKLEVALGTPMLGWEKFHKPLRAQLAWTRRVTMAMILLFCVAVSSVGLLEAMKITIYCAAK